MANQHVQFVGMRAKGYTLGFLLKFVMNLDLLYKKYNLLT